MAVGPLTIGLSDALYVREERVSPWHGACRLTYVSDVHLRPGRSDNLCQQIISAARSADSDVLVLGGDLVDRPTELGKLRDLVRSMGEIAPVFAVGGNHDERVGMERVRHAIIDGGGTWIHTSNVRLTHGSRTITLSGPEAATLPDGDFRVLCAHYPGVWKTARQSGYDLVLAGHLHGCQFVAFEYRNRLFPGAVFYRYCYLRHQVGATRLVVSRGVSDLVPIRWHCPREVVLCHV